MSRVENKRQGGQHGGYCTGPGLCEAGRKGWEEGGGRGNSKGTELQVKLSVTRWHLPRALSTSTRIKPRAAAAGLQHRLKGVQDGEQKRGTLRSAGVGVGD